jgi:SAM-dependent methyltransferase
MQDTIHSPFDHTAAEAFAERVSQKISDGAVAVMLSVGHKLGLLDALARLGPATSHELATEAGLAERYVREWLAVMVTGGIAHHRPVNATYELPGEHAACLTRGAALGNLAVYAQTVALIGAIEGRLLDCFRTGQGTTYGDYPCFHQFMEEDSEQTVVAALFDTILPLAEGANEQLEQGMDVLDAGCGRGRALIALAERFPRSRFVGYDLCEDAIAYARHQAVERRLSNVRFEVVDLTNLDEADVYDLVLSFDAIHDQKSPQGLLNRLLRALRPGGRYIVQDIGGSARLENNLDFPMAPLLYAISCAHCTPISLGQGGEGLGTMWGWETAEAMLADAGFNDIRRSVFPHDPMNVWFVCSKEAGHVA